LGAIASTVDPEPVPDAPDLTVMNALWLPLVHGQSKPLVAVTAIV
jgi:hypothetical protein